MCRTRECRHKMHRACHGSHGSTRRLDLSCSNDHEVILQNLAVVCKITISVNPSRYRFAGIFFMFFHFLRTRGNLKINWHIFHCKLTRCCSLFINSLEVQLQTTVARILCKLYIINVVPYAACRTFPQECQKNQRAKKCRKKKLGVFA